MNDSRISPLFVALSLSLGLLSESPAVIGEYGGSLEAGIRAYDAGDFSTAAYFLAQVKDPTPRALYLLGTLYQHGLGVKQDDAVAENLFTSAAQVGSIDAQLQLGLIYLDIDVDTAWDWLELAVEGGSEQARFLQQRVLNGDFAEAC